MLEPKKITREQASKIIESEIVLNALPRPAVTCYKGIWWDIRGIAQDEADIFISKLIQGLYEPEKT